MLKLLTGYLYLFHKYKYPVSMKEDRYKKAPILRLFSLIFVLVFVFSSSLSISAATPRILSFQGRLTNSAGDLLGSSGTDYYFKFSIYNASSSGTELWTSSATGIAIKVTQGVFNTLLGDTTAGFNSLNLDFDSTTNYYLEVQVSSNNADFEVLTPRQRIVSSGFAINADTVHGGRFINAAGVGQFGGLATISYSRFGTAVTSHGLNTSSDALVSGMFETDGQAFFNSSASVSTNFEVGGYASASKYFGGGLSNVDCSNNASQKLLYINGLFSCGNDQTTAGVGSTVRTVKQGATILSGSAALNFFNGFSLIASGSYETNIGLDYATGPASRSIAQTISGLWTFSNGASVSTNLEIGGTASIGGNISTKGTLNTHTIPAGTGTLALTSDIHAPLTLAGLTYLTLNGQEITANKINLATNVVGTLSIASTSFNAANFLSSGGGTLSGNLIGTGATFSANFELTGTASIGGNISTKGTLASSNTGSTS